MSGLEDIKTVQYLFMCGSSTQSTAGSAEKTGGKDTKQSLSNHPAGGKDTAAG